jgi:ADP-heptose:LPS heptosyltransferase
MLLTSSGVRIILTGLPEERLKYGRELERFSGNPRVWNAMGELSLRQLCSVMVHVSAVVSVGTGPMHLASALGVPTISPFCQKVGVCSRVWGNLGSKSTVIEAPPALCAQRPHDAHCDFQGCLQPAQLLNATLETLNNR